MPTALHSCDSLERPSSSASPGSSMETRTSTPAPFIRARSSSSQSPPRGRGTIASLRASSVSTQKIFILQCYSRSKARGLGCLLPFRWDCAQRLENLMALDRCLAARNTRMRGIRDQPRGMSELPSLPFPIFGAGLLFTGVLEPVELKGRLPEGDCDEASCRVALVCRFGICMCRVDGNGLPQWGKSAYAAPRSFGRIGNGGRAAGARVAYEKGGGEDVDWLGCDAAVEHSGFAGEASGGAVDDGADGLDLWRWAEESAAK